MGGGVAVENSTIPRMGLGTFGLTGEPGVKSLLNAISIGYRHFDTAQSYGTEESVGEAIARSDLDRDAIFVTTKVRQENLGRLAASLDDSLRTLQLDHVDLLLIHWPATNDNPPVRDYIGRLAEVQDKGKARLIGVSNFTRRHVDEAIAELGPGRIATNQIEQHLFLQNRVIADHCHDAGIAITAYMPLANNEVDMPAVTQIARKYKAGPNQIALAYLLAIGSIVIPRSASPDHQKSNFDSSNLTLDADDMKALAAMDAGRRRVDPPWAPKWD